MHQVVLGTNLPVVSNFFPPFRGEAEEANSLGQLPSSAFAYPLPSSPFSPGMKISPEVIACTYLFNPAVGRGLITAGKKLLEAYVLTKAVEKIDEKMHLFEPQEKRQEELLKQLNQDVLYKHVVDLMVKTEQTMSDPTIRFEDKILQIRAKQRQLESILEQNLNGRSHLTFEEKTYLQNCTQKTEDALRKMWNNYELAADTQVASKEDLLYQIADELGSLAGGMNIIDQQTREASQQMLQAIHKYQEQLQRSEDAIIAEHQLQQNLQFAKAGFECAALISQIAGNHQLAHQITTGGQSLMKVIGSIAQINRLKEAGLSAVFPHYVAIASAIYSIFSLFSQAQSQEQKILESIMDQLKTLSKQVERLRTEMHTRFDRLEGLLSDYHRDVLDQFSHLWQLQVVQASHLKEISQKIDALSIQSFQYAHQSYVSNFKDQLTLLYCYKDMHGDKEPETLVDQMAWAETFYMWAVAKSKEHTLLTNSISSSPAESALDFNTLSLHLQAIPLEGNIQFLAKYAAQYIPGIKIDAINSIEWLRASEAYLYLRNTFPHLKFDPKGKCVDGIIACGKERLDFSKNLQRERKFFSILCQLYKDSVGNAGNDISGISLRFFTERQQSLEQEFNLIKEKLKQERQGEAHPGSLLARYGHAQPGVSHSVNRNRRLSELTLNYDDYIAKLQSSVSEQEKTFQSFRSIVNLIALIKTPDKVDLPLSPSLIVFFQDLPLDLRGLVNLPREAVIAELLGLGRVHIEADIVEDHIQIDHGHIDDSPFKKDRTQHLHAKFVISVAFVTSYGEKQQLQRLESTPLFFPSYYWIRSAFKKTEKPQKRELAGIPTRWGKDKHEKKRIQQYGDVGEVLQAGSQAYILKNYLQAKEVGMFQSFIPTSPWLNIFFNHHQKEIWKVLYTYLTACIESPLDLESRALSHSLTALDARQKMLRAFCSLAFPESSIKEPIATALMLPGKALCGKAELMESLKATSHSNDSIDLFHQLKSLLEKTGAFETELMKIIDKITTNKQGTQGEEDPSVKEMIGRLHAFKHEKYEGIAE